ncbi:MAG: alanine racemase [Pirellulales bacterium]
MRHFVGHLQRNKVSKTRQVSPHSSGDSLRLLEAIHADVPAGHSQKVLLEINISGDEAKHGFTPSEVKQCLPHLLALDRLEICGLMGMAGLTANETQTREQFQSLRILRDELQTEIGSACQLSELSMGMSDDFEQAILEGATLIRIGSALFEGLLDGHSP